MYGGHDEDGGGGDEYVDNDEPNWIAIANHGMELEPEPETVPEPTPRPDGWDGYDNEDEDD